MTTMAPVNLEEIGRRAGVSRSTVSRVVNGSPRVSPEAKQRVEAVIAETGYQPHAAARSLASRRTGVVGLVIPSTAESLFDDPYFGRLILGVTEATNASGITVALFLFNQDADEHSIIGRVVNPGLVDGVIVTATRMADPLIGHLSRSDLPFVVVGRPDDEDAAPFWVDADNRGGARAAARHLVALGRVRPAMIAPPSDTTAGDDRRLGFSEGLDEAGLKVGSRMAVGDWTEESGRLAMAELLATDPRNRPDSVFVGSDRMAVGALRALAEAGVSCPEEIAVVSFDGLLSPGQAGRRLTSVAQPVKPVGIEAARLLADVIDGKVTRATGRVLPTELIIGTSTDPSATS